MKVKCGNCKQYIEKTDASKRGINYFCNSDCIKAKAFSAPKKKFTKSKKRDTFEKDGFRCRYCGNSGDLITHHVIYRSEVRNRQWRDEDSNLISLCNSPCHLEIIHSNKKKYQPLCLQVIWRREIKGDKLTLIKDLEKEDYEFNL